MSKIERKDDAMPLDIQIKSKTSKKNKTNNIDDSCLKAAGDLSKQKEEKTKSVLNEDEDAALHDKGNIGNDGNLAKKANKKRGRDSSEDNHLYTENAQIEGKEQGPVDEPDSNLESRKDKKRKHEVHEKENSEILKNSKLVDGESNIKSTVEKQEGEEGQTSKGKKKKKVKSKKVSFSGHVEVFPSCDTDNLVRGKRFTLEEDEIVKEAVLNFIKSHDLGEEGLIKVLNSKSYPEIKNCWKEIGTCIPYRPFTAIYYRAHILFERAEKREWTEEETEFIKKSYEKHGNNWKMVAEELGKHRIHVKDKWRRIKHKNIKEGKWSQEEYQSLYDLVNLDLQMKVVSQEKKSKHGMLKDNIPWGAISDKLTTRNDNTCCKKWYTQLTSSLVAEDKWSNADDYRLISALYELDAACVEDVDWDGVLEHRSGDVCKKRWDQMVLHIGHHGSSPFSEQVEILSQRYCPDLAETREAWDSKPRVP